MSDYTKWYLSFHNKKDNTQENIETINRYIKKITFGIIPTLIESPIETEDDKILYRMDDESNGSSLYQLENQLGLLRPLISVSKKMPDVILHIEGIGEYGYGDEIFIKNGLVAKRESTREEPHNWHILDLKWSNGKNIKYDWKGRHEEIKFDKKWDKTRNRLYDCAKNGNLIRSIMRMPKAKQEELFKYIKEFLKKNA